MKRFIITLLKGLVMIILSIILMASSLIHHPLDKLALQVIYRLQNEDRLGITFLLLLGLVMLRALDLVPKYLNQGSVYLLSKLKPR